MKRTMPPAIERTYLRWRARGRWFASCYLDAKASGAPPWVLGMLWAEARDWTGNARRLMELGIPESGIPRRTAQENVATLAVPGLE